jgi:hypothetical protein
VLVGETFADHKDGDALLQVPFVSFGREGCSAWVTDRVAEAGVSEADLLWVNADSPRLGEVIEAHARSVVIALGNEALKRLQNLGLTEVIAVEHPQHAKRFKHGKRYQLVDELRRLT